MYRVSLHLQLNVYDLLSKHKDHKRTNVKYSKPYFLKRCCTFPIKIPFLGLKRNINGKTIYSLKSFGAGDLFKQK